MFGLSLPMLRTSNPRLSEITWRETGSTRDGTARENEVCFRGRTDGRGFTSPSMSRYLRLRVERTKGRTTGFYRSRYRIESSGTRWNVAWSKLHLRFGLTQRIMSAIKSATQDAAIIARTLCRILRTFPYWQRPCGPSIDLASLVSTQRGGGNGGCVRYNVGPVH